MPDLTLDMKTTILASSLSLGGVGLLGAFAAHSDLLAIAPAWSAMFIKIARQGGRSLDKNKALKIATGVLAGAGSLIGGIKLANTYFAYTGVGTVPAVLINGSVNGVLTWLAGRAWAHIVLEEDPEGSIENLTRSILSALSGWLSFRD